MGALRIAVITAFCAAAAAGAVTGKEPREGHDPDGCRLLWVSGSVDSVDWTGQKFSLRPFGYVPYLSIPGSIPGSIRFLVTRDTGFIQQTRTLGFASLAQSDEVSVLFCAGDLTDPVALRVVINNSYPKN